MERPPPDGFTLAEVLITIGIIGVVAALTLPTLINNTAPFIDSFPNGIKSYGSITPVNGKLNSTASDYYNLSMLRYDGSPIHRQGLYRGSIQLNDGLTFTIYNYT